MDKGGGGVGVKKKDAESGKGEAEAGDKEREDTQSTTTTLRPHTHWGKEEGERSVKGDQRHAPSFSSLLKDATHAEEDGGERTKITAAGKAKKQHPCLYVFLFLFLLLSSACGPSCCIGTSQHQDKRYTLTVAHLNQKKKNKSPNKSTHTYTHTRTYKKKKLERGLNR